VRVIIIGGGITGLSAAHELAARGVPFVLLEASDRTGGLIFTELVDGYTIDSGADSMLAQKPAAVQLCEELGLGPRLIASTPPRTAYVHARGRLHAIPSPSVFGIPTTRSGIAKYDLLPWTARIRMMRGLERNSLIGSDLDSIRKSRSDRADESVASFFRRKFGPATVSLIADPLIGGIHAGDVELLSITSVAPRLVQGAPTDSPSGGEGLFRSLRAGMGEMVTAIEQRLPPGSVRLGSEATAVSRAASTWQVAYGSGTLEARAVIIAAPAHAAARLLAQVDPALTNRCAEVPYVSTVSVALSWPRTSVAHPLNGSGFVVARRHSPLRITACTWVTSKWPGRAPADMVLLRAFLGGTADPDAAGLSDETLLQIATRDVANVLGITGAPRLARVHRWLRAGAQHNVGHVSRLAQIDERLASLPGLFVAGSGFRAIGVPDCVADGRAAALEAVRHVRMI